MYQKAVPDTVAQSTRAPNGLNMQESISGQSGSHSRELEAARGIAILLVLLLHYTPFFFSREQVTAGLGPLAFIPSTGRTGVVLFFVLSAFLLSRPFWVERAGGRQPSISIFYYRRVLRIVPLFYIAVLVAFLWVGDGGAAIRSLLFVPDHGLLKPFSGVWWSLRTEAQFYVLLGLSIWVLRKPRWRWFALTAFAAFAVAHMALIFGAFESMGWVLGKASFPVLLSVAHQWPAFAFGVLISWLHVNWGPAWRQSAAQSSWFGRGGGDVAMLLILVALGVALSWVDAISFFVLVKNYGTWPFIEGGLWATFVFGLLILPLRTRPVFVNAPLEFLGRISYSLYLIHVPFNILTGAVRYQARVAIFGTGDRSLWIATADMLALWLLTVGVSWLSYKFIEQPFVSLKNRIGKPA